MVIDVRYDYFGSGINIGVGMVDCYWERGYGVIIGSGWWFYYCIYLYVVVVLFGLLNLVVVRVRINL